MVAGDGRAARHLLGPGTAGGSTLARNGPARPTSLALSVVFALLGGCDLTGPCEDTTLAKVPSPDGKLAAVVSVRDCGATTARAVHVSIVAASDGPPREGANTFVIEQGAGVVAEWLAPRELLVSYEPRGRVFMQESRVGEVSVSYREQ